MAPRRLFNFVITDDLAEGLKTVKERDGISESEQVRRAVAAWLEARGIVLKSESKGRSAKGRRK